MLDPRREPSPRFFRTFLDLTWTEGTEGRDGEDPEVMTGTQIQQAGAPNLDPGTQMVKKKPTTCLLHWPLADVRHFLPVCAEAAASVPVLAVPLTLTGDSQGAPPRHLEKGPRGESRPRILLQTVWDLTWTSQWRKICLKKMKSRGMEENVTLPADRRGHDVCS